MIGGFYLDLIIARYVNIGLKRNEIKTYDNRFMKFDWDFEKYSFYSSDNVHLGSRPVSHNEFSLFHETLLMV